MPSDASTAAYRSTRTQGKVGNGQNAKTRHMTMAFNWVYGVYPWQVVVALFCVVAQIAGLFALLSGSNRFAGAAIAISPAVLLSLYFLGDGVSGQRHLASLFSFNLIVFYVPLLIGLAYLARTRQSAGALWFAWIVNSFVLIFLEIIFYVLKSGH